MIKKLNFEQIHPFIRFVRFLNSDNNNIYPQYIPYDCRLLYSYSGTGIICINEKEYNMQKGSILLWQSAVPYQLLKPNEGGVTYLAINFDYSYDFYNKYYPIPPDTKENFVLENVLEKISLTDLKIFNKPVYLNNMQIIEKDLLELKTEFMQRKRFCNNKMSAMLQNILVTVARRASSLSYDTREPLSRADEIIEYIQTNYNNTITNGKIGEIFNYHPNYINNLMVMNTGLSLHKYINSIRISKAISLLETTSIQISEIVAIIGFKDICHFSRYFKKTTGRTPSDFRSKPM